MISKGKFEADEDKDESDEDEEVKHKELSNPKLLSIKGKTESLNINKSNNKSSTQIININAAKLITTKKGKITKDYEILNVIGKGAFGEVKKVIHKVS